MTLQITSETLESLQQDFVPVWYESGMSNELDGDYESAEANYINFRLCTSDWELVD